MRASIKNYMDALEKQRIERGEDGGFSLIELIIVVVILGILAAIAIPIFMNIQDEAEKNADKTVAANAATQWAAGTAQGDTITWTNFPEYNISVAPAAPTLDAFCVTATLKTDATRTAKAGPSC